MSDPIGLFRQALYDNGLGYSGPILTDTVKPVRFKPDDHRGLARDAWYVLHTDGKAAGAFGDWKTGLHVKWVSDERSVFDAAAKAEFERKAKARAEAEAVEQARVAKQAQRIWACAKTAPASHPYLVRKGLPPTGLRVATWAKTGTADCLLVPIRHNKVVVNLQAIFPAKCGKLGRDKDFLRGGRKQGCFHLIGKWDKASAIVLCEGFATGASIHIATGLPVLVCFDAGNLTPVAELCRSNCPKCEIIIAADNDAFKPHAGNTGVREATRAMRAVGGRVVVPRFKDVSSQPTDFNDLHSLEGAAAIRACFAC